MAGTQTVKKRRMRQKYNAELKKAHEREQQEREQQAFQEAAIYSSLQSMVSNEQEDEHEDENDSDYNENDNDESNNSAEKAPFAMKSSDNHNQSNNKTSPPPSPSSPYWSPRQPSFQSNTNTTAVFPSNLSQATSQEGTPDTPPRITTSISHYNSPQHSLSATRTQPRRHIRMLSSLSHKKGSMSGAGDSFPDLQVLDVSEHAILFPSSVSSSRFSTSLSTGRKRYHERMISHDDGTLFRQAFTIRPKHERKPMDWFKRMKKETLTLPVNNNPSTRKNDDNNENMDAIEEEQEDNTHNETTGTTKNNIITKHHPQPQPSQSSSSTPNHHPKQYIFKSEKKRKSLWSNFVHTINPDDFTYEPNSYIKTYINWTFRTDFFSVFMSFLCVFMILILFFGVLLMLAGMGKGQCFIVGDGDFTMTDAGLADGFALSWTTFTTVGYGAVYPATGNEYNKQFECVWITIITTTESFVGLLYAGMCAAILFGKVERIQSHAQVRFSDAVCIEYGKRERYGRMRIHNDNGDDKMVHDNKNKSDVTKMNKNGLTRSQSDMNFHSVGTFDSDTTENATGSSRSPKECKYQCPVLKFQLCNELANQPCGEILDATLNCIIRKEDDFPLINEAYARFSTVELQESSHPFFNQIWQGRHVLNEVSPMLSHIARKRISQNNGYWPEEWNDPKIIREHLKFSTMIVTMTGISNISAESVQIARRFYKQDILIGYEFAPMLYKREDSPKLKVDMTLINDVVEQYWAPNELQTHHGNKSEHPSLCRSFVSCAPTLRFNK